MTDRLKGVWVAFEEDIREDDAEPIINAIKALRGVADVRGLVVDSNDYINRRNIRTEVANEVMALLDKLLKS